MIKFNILEPSTKRGLAMASASFGALLQVVPKAQNVTSLLSQPEFWLAVGGVISGLIGMFTSDEADSK